MRPTAVGFASCVSALAAVALISGCDPAPDTAGDSPTAAPHTADTPTTAPDRPCNCDRPASFAPAVERVRPAVVNLYSAEPTDPDDAPSDELRGFIPDKRLHQSLGSGVIIDDDGHLITNHHVVDRATDIRARLLDDRWFETTLVGTDPKTDLALLKLVDADDVPHAPLTDDTELNVGDWVVAIGNPLGLTSTVTVGITSGIGRSRLPLGDELKYQDFIQTDASINPGNSGGPLVDADGHIVGINTAITRDARGIGFAIPLSMVREIVPKLKKSGQVERAWIGLYVDPVPDPLRKEIDIGATGGVLVTGVVDDGPARQAGIRKGDVIVKLDGEPVDDVDHVSWLAGNLSIGEKVEAVVQRGSQRIEAEIVPTKPPAQ